MTNEFNEKAEILYAKFFPPPPEADLSDLATAVYFQQINTHTEITDEEITFTIRKSLADKAPGVSQITNRVLKSGI